MIAKIALKYVKTLFMTISFAVSSALLFCFVSQSVELKPQVVVFASLYQPVGSYYVRVVQPVASAGKCGSVYIYTA